MAAEHQQPQHGAPQRRFGLDRLKAFGQRAGGSGVLEHSGTPSRKPPDDTPDDTPDDLSELDDEDLAPTLPQLLSVPRMQAMPPPPPPTQQPLTACRLRIAADWSTYVITRDWIRDERLAGVSPTARMCMFSLLARLYQPVTAAARREETPEQVVGQMTL